MAQNNSKNVNEMVICPDQEPTLTPQQTKALSLLLTGNSQALIAKEVGVTIETISRWKNHNPQFVAAYRRGVIAAGEAVDNAIIELSNDAVETLRKLLEARDDKVRLVAAKTILSVRPMVEVKETSPGKIENELALPQE